MVPIEGEIFINRPVEEVFDFVADERNESSYNTQMRRVEKIMEGPIGVGTQYRAELMRMGRAIRMVIEFTGFERPRRIDEVAHMSSMDLRGGLIFDPVPGGTRMRWSWEVQPRGILKLMGPLVAHMGQRQERRIWTALKRLLEAPATSPASA